MIIERARRSGANVPTRLNDAGLLWTKEKEAKTYLGALRDFQVAMRGWMPHEYLRTVNRSLVNCTPTEMYEAILKWVGKYIEQVEIENR
jgi:hypothetical protein